jgi:hypothetical protein
MNVNHLNMRELHLEMLCLKLKIAGFQSGIRASLISN